jgi:hypothetical protein
MVIFETCILSREGGSPSAIPFVPLFRLTNILAWFRKLKKYTLLVYYDVGYYNIGFENVISM